eukprot:CAMPEP_0197524332 /NCGR_PEP_ID=MMETSP1318-20131121/9038_1 /TAXON_ID=552666 /ORGANISM="Partenskyella glossopodia, Strain RCC365" /LENGTH=316 /DNA_ID=CAMNT_0043077265 /DNA_START=175 /DNA_END=1122 /DNA_ORIENTATION=+
MLTRAIVLALLLPSGAPRSAPHPRISSCRPAPWGKLTYRPGSLQRGLLRLEAQGLRGGGETAAESGNKVADADGKEDTVSMESEGGSKSSEGDEEGGGGDGDEGEKEAVAGDMEEEKDAAVQENNADQSGQAEDQGIKKEDQMDVEVPAVVQHEGSMDLSGGAVVNNGNSSSSISSSSGSNSTDGKPLVKQKYMKKGEWHYYVTFFKRPLGILFAQWGWRCVAQSANNITDIEFGDVVKSVNEIKCEKEGFGNITELIAKSKMPMTILFRRPETQRTRLLNQIKEIESKEGKLGIASRLKQLEEVEGELVALKKKW